MDPDDDFFWQFAIGLVIFTGVILYWSGLSTIGFWPTFFVHLGLIVAYILMIGDLGRSSHIVIGFNIVILTILVSILFPVFHRNRLNAQRQKAKQSLSLPPRVAATGTPTRPNPTPSSNTPR